MGENLMLLRPQFEELKKSLDLQKQAAANGVQLLPSSNSVVPDSVEDAIQSKLRSLHRDNCEVVSNKLAAERLKRSNLSRTVSEDALVREIQDMQSKASGQLQELEAKKRNRIKELLKTELKNQRQYNAFRVLHCLQHREAHYPSSQWLHWAYLACFLLLESIFNSYFFKEATDAGFLGGIFIAGMISVVNVMFAYFLGSFVIPQFHLVHPGIRTVLASAGMLACVTAIIFSNLAAAHTRAIIASNQASQVTSTEAFQQAILQLKDRPLGIDHLEAWILLGLGLGIAALAIWKGYTADDPYPGYGELDRQLKEAKNEYSREREAYTHEIIARVMQIRQELEAFLRKAQSTVAEYHNSIKESNQAAHEYSEALAEDNRILVAMVRYYREVNKSVRTNPYPAYFDRDPDIIIQTDLGRVSPQEEQEAQDLKRMITKLQDTCEETRRSLGNLQEAYLARLEELHKNWGLEAENELRREAAV